MGRRRRGECVNLHLEVYMFTNNRMFIMMMMMITGETSVMKCTLLECNEPSLVIPAENLSVGFPG